MLEHLKKGKEKIQIGPRISPDVCKQLLELSQKEGVSISLIVEDSLREYFKRLKD